MKKSTHVSIAIIRKKMINADYQYQYLVAWREQTKHQGNCYEFVGGKVDEGETPVQALIRECQEELNITITKQRKITQLTHDYADKRVCLHVFLVTDYQGQEQGAEAQTIEWIDAKRLKTLSMPQANQPIQRMALLCEDYFISQSVADFSDWQTANSQIVNIKNSQKDNYLDVWLSYYIDKLPAHAQFYARDKHIAVADYVYLVENLLKNRPDLSVFVLYQYKTQLIQSDFIASQIKGFHLSHQDILAKSVVKTADTQTNAYTLIGACHDKQSIAKANALQLDAITLSPVYQTTKYDDSPVQPLGWQQFSQLAKHANCPVYALGGITKIYADNEEAQNKAFGIAGISVLSQLITGN